MAPKANWDPWATPLPEIAEILNFIELHPGRAKLDCHPWHREIVMRSKWVVDLSHAHSDPMYHITEAGRRALRRYRKAA